MRILLGTENAKDIIVFVYGFAVISSLLLVPPVCVGVSELARDWGGVYVAAVHIGVVDVFLGEKAPLGVGEGGGGAEKAGWGSRGRD